jgi:four helix bundle protein
MSRLEIKMPEFYPFQHEMKIRKTDIAKDLHVSFASILDIVFEAHLRFFKYLGYEVTNVLGLSLIFADATVLYRGELLEDDVVKIEVTADGFFDKGCDLYFHLTKNESKTLVSDVKIRMLFFDYSIRKVALVPPQFKSKIESLTKSSSVPSSIGIRHTDSPLWNSAHQFVMEIYKLTSQYPALEKDHLVMRMKKAATSLPLSIVEAGRKKEKADILRAFGRTRGYLEELRYYLILSSDLGFADTKSSLIDLEAILTDIKKTLKPILESE